MSNQSDLDLFTTFTPTFAINGQEKESRKIQRDPYGDGIEVKKNRDGTKAQVVVDGEIKKTFRGENADQQAHQYAQEIYLNNFAKEIVANSQKESVEQIWLNGWDPETGRTFKEPKYYPDTGHRMSEAKLTKQELYDILIRDGLSPEEAKFHIEDFRDYGSGGRGGFLEGRQYAPRGPQV
jgi:hypothetical protein